ncbi:transcriptional activator Mut3p [Plectosphaerella plurivora]|uniref:Transcriptional activator Mut3p n=1 Tax=Plectosphaerella plurivora TaxID=936078 RepID=A0A9P9ACS0_9PEZI|nr:transcriptional activator Mut3p [Plectosphaerella plurivora]
MSSGGNSASRHTAPPSHTSADSGIVPDMSDDEDLQSLSGHHDKDGSQDDGSSHSLTDDESKVKSEEAGANGLPVQKRRRVTRACDECRRKKIKCDGKQPCTHCAVYSYECTYDKPSNRRRNPAPQYLEALESRLQRAESLLRQFMPDVDLNDPSLDPSVQQEFRTREVARSQGKMAPGRPGPPGREDTQLLSMIESIGQLDLDEQGGWDFYGVSSGAVFLRRMKEHFQGLMGPEKESFLPRKEKLPGLATLDSPASASSSPLDAFPSQGPELPPKEYARQLCTYSISCATCLIRIVHTPSFWEMFERIYEKPYEAYTSDEHHFLGLMYATMGLGCMYSSLDKDNQMPYKDAVEQGTKFYEISRKILPDMTECRDITSLQALLFMILFLQATSNFSACYAHVGIALRSSVRMGLHRHLQHEQIGIIEQEVRKRVFYVVRQMDIYVSAMMGFPLLHNSEDIDQPYPTEVDDEYITNEGIVQPPLGTPSYFEAFNAYTKLMEILARIVKNVYPLKGLSQTVMKGDKPGTSYHISYSSIKKIEGELQEWYRLLPPHWRPNADGPIEAIRVRHLLRFAYAHVQLVLYRPFLHYVSPRLSMGKHVDELSYACAAAAISVSRNIVHIGIEIRKQGVLAGPYWVMLYTEFFAVMSLVFYAVENPEKPGSGDVLSDAKAGKDMIADLKTKSQAAERVSIALELLFEQLPERLQQARARPIPSKKRSAADAMAASVPSYGHPAIHHGQIHRRSEEFSRPSSAAMSNGRMQHAPVRSSFDSIVPGVDGSYRDSGFGGDWQEAVPPLDMSRATPESTTSSHSRASTFPQQGMANGNTIHKLDSLMFPSGDPFAYPNQPMMQLGYPKPVSGPQSATISAPLTASMTIPGSFDDFDANQFLGQSSSSYSMQQQQQQQQSQHHHQHYNQQPSQQGLDLSNMYQQQHQPQPSMLGMQDAQRLEHARRAAQMQRPMDNREMERMLAESGYQGSWGNMYARTGF